MQILSYHPERGDIRVKAESLEDLWHLDHILEEGDCIKGKTFRRAEQKSDVLRPQRAEKKLVTLTIRAEKIDFHQYSNWLRVTGSIIEGEDAGSYHTINVEEGTVLTITKKWRQYHLNRLREAVSESTKPKILIVVLDDEGADFGILRQFGLEEVATIYSRIPGKREPSQRKAAKHHFYEEISKKITEYELSVIVAGPGFTKEEFKKYFKEVHGKDVMIESVSTTGRTGLYEVVKRGYIEKVYQDSKTAKDIQLVEQLFCEILKAEAEAERVSVLEEQSPYVPNLFCRFGVDQLQHGKAFGRSGRAQRTRMSGLVLATTSPISCAGTSRARSAARRLAAASPPTERSSPPEVCGS